MTDRNLKLGHYFKGSEPCGCFNTGVAPVIARSKQAKKYTGKEYLVGRDLDVLYDMTGVILTKMRGKTTKAKFFASKKAAFKLFEKMEAQMRAGIQAEQKTILALREKAKAGDMGATLELAGY